MDDVPTARIVHECLGPADGHEATVYLLNNSTTGLPQQLHPQLIQHFKENLPNGRRVYGEISDEVPDDLKHQGAFAKVVFIGLKPKKALITVRRITKRFLQFLVPPAVRREERNLRQERRRRIEETHRRSRYCGRRECRIAVTSYR